MLGLASVKFGFIICFRVCKVNQLRVFLSAATTAEKAELAERSGTTLGTLNQVAGGYRRGGQAVVRAGLAMRIEAAAAELRKRNRSLPELYRTDLSPECRGCDFAQRCLGNKTAGGDFAVLPD